MAQLLLLPPASFPSWWVTPSENATSAFQSLLWSRWGERKDVCCYFALSDSRIFFLVNLRKIPVSLSFCLSICLPLSLSSFTSFPHHHISTYCLSSFFKQQKYENGRQEFAVADFWKNMFPCFLSFYTPKTAHIHRCDNFFVKLI